MGEEEVEKVGGKFSIVRIAYPFGSINPDKDYILKLIKNVNLDRPIFADQNFTPTYIPTLSKALRKVITDKISGKFHVVCSEVTTPYKIAKFLAERLNLSPEVKKGSILEYEKTIGKKAPYNPSGGLNTEVTQKTLDLEFPSWEEAVGEFIDKIPQE